MSALAALALAAAPRPSVAQGAARTGVAGTYEIQLCTAACSFGDTAHVAGRGVVVLDSVPIRVSLEALQKLTGWRVDTDSARQKVRRAYEETQARPGDTNGCVAVRRWRNVQDWMVRGFTLWTREPAGEIEFFLATGADYGYLVRVAPAGGVLAGTGHEHGMGVDHGPEVVVMRRIGPPRAEACVD
jgi:hypothetical protein